MKRRLRRSFRLQPFSLSALPPFLLLLITACSHTPLFPPTPAPSPRLPLSASPSPPVLPPGALLPSPNLLVGRIIAVDTAQGFAFIQLASDAPPAALAEGAPLIARTEALRETARLAASRYVRGRTLGTRIVAGQPSPGDEVVFPAP